MCTWAAIHGIVVILVMSTTKTMVPSSDSHWPRTVLYLRTRRIGYLRWKRLQESASPCTFNLMRTFLPFDFGIGDNEESFWKDDIAAVSRRSLFFLELLACLHRSLLSGSQLPCTYAAKLSELCATLLRFLQLFYNHILISSHSSCLKAS